jgi:hypothetical protein
VVVESISFQVSGKNNDFTQRRKNDLLLLLLHYAAGNLREAAMDFAARALQSR